MISYLEAYDRLQKVAEAKKPQFLQESETYSLEPDCIQGLVGRIAVSDQFVKEAIPPFDNSSMDGFALRAEWLVNASKTNPLEIPIHGVIFAGENSALKLSAAEVSGIEIMTGAPMPAGADCVVKVEDVECVPQPSGQVKAIRVTQSLRVGENVRKKGTDFQLNQRLLKAGSPLSAEHILGMATVGIARVAVTKRPKVALISTGNELVDRLSDPLSNGMIRNSTAPYLMSALPLFGVEGVYYGTVKDDAGAFKTLLKRVLADKPDVILTTGAVSKGKLDFVPDALRAMGAQIHFHGVAIKPGKPLLMAEFADGPAVFAVPGNPISTAVALRFFISPYLRALQGLPPETFEIGILNGTTEKADGLRCFWKASVETDETGRQVTSLVGQESYRVGSLLTANAWLILAEDGEKVMGGSRVQTVPLYPKMNLGDIESHEEGCC